MNRLNQRARLMRGLGVLAASTLLAAFPICIGGCKSTDSGARGFASPEEGARALVAALRPLNDQELAAILGPDGKEIISSGDEVADRQAAEAFAASYDRRHRIVQQDDEATLVVGEDEWPLPIPLALVDGKWRFDTEAGKSEILARRVGRNELSAIETCRAIVDAQREYAAMNPGASEGDAEPVYAQKFASDPGQHNGLYWQTREGEPPSPLGPLVADAVAEGYGARGTNDEGPRPFHGYFYRMLTAQGPSASGGARSYLKDGRMTGGFAVVAWPVEYGNSGIMTFIVRGDGIVYEKDLGEDTASAAAAMTAFDPGEGWKVSP